ncbi:MULTISPECIES: DUF4440 domain-containing protein [unclassified Herbaspirillum]|uniref:DUF4440 domain-containing protein n=1 Tax=unclassified Herbaspirillum TaxID=2624150 RepID=UPI0011548F70|nr:MULTISPECIES: DUF4440 domain-containing protein [unclassified Herbaspirillum]MBB5390175.1 ketosteroid isomerase-like protein [Herbaspirillum sp. SJZ102]TQK09326.1 uncharacterized protein DUF4440 [Herbaspirillum sp. SJZ130]TQK13987.1 uncharacterized protein DUF4440 [Herbaspirillum sp. SJZ106]
MNINLAIEKLQTLCRNGDAAKLHREMFSNDCSISGEGAQGITVGSDLLPALTEMLKVTPKLSIRSVRTVELTENAAVTWLEWSSPSADGKGDTISFRSLTAWRKETDTWRIVADMYGFGLFSAS